MEKKLKDHSIAQSSGFQWHELQNDKVLWKLLAVTLGQPKIAQSRFYLWSDFHLKSDTAIAQLFSNNSPSLSEQHYTLCYHNLMSEPDGDLNASFLWLSLIHENRNGPYKDESFPFAYSLFYFPQHIPQAFHL